MHRRAELIVAALLVSACHAPPPVVARAGTIEISDPYAFAPVVGDEGSAYFTLKNVGTTDDTLTGISAGSGIAMLHGSRQDGQVVSMVMLDNLPLPAGASDSLVPGQKHLMLTGLNPVPHPGDTLHLHLTFAKSGGADLAVPVYRYGERSR
ncbi:MAG TPA: copper chaperone PCu(A)C [Gemmatimonadales bacterium]|nr:copper chaperone PCu(A)C [Gemmatimonadales bacterium]